MSRFEELAQEYFQKNLRQHAALNSFYDSLSYSFFSGGKRVRPKVSFLVGACFDLNEEEVFPASLAVELIHTYSLIHDDLPAMDDDTYRRGKLSHHAKYGEASAILSGDALLTSAFEVLADTYEGESLKPLVKALSHCAGANGMVGGQYLDCLTKERSLSIFETIHYLKTAKLFEYSFVAPGILAKKSKEEIQDLQELGNNVGLLFQLQDDLFDEDKKDEREEENILYVVSKEELQKDIENKKSIILDKTANFKELSQNQSYQTFIEDLLNRKK